MTGKPDTIKDHYERINKVLQYVNNHLAENLDLGNLASMSSYSAFHFHRIMRAYLGESLGSYIIRVRLDAAANLLKMTEVPVNDIAFKVGYENAPSFNKAFKKRFGIAPNEFRDDKHAQLLADGTFINPLKNDIMEIIPKIKELKDKKVIYVQTIGKYSDTAGFAWEKVCGYAAKNRLFGFGTELIGVSYDDPTVTEPEKCRYEACITVSKDVKPDGEIGVKQINGGKYAIFTVKGPYEMLSPAYQFIFGKWMQENNVALRDVPCYEVYLNDPKKTKPEKIKTEIRVPIK
jgi:AraC family transcriptional regulator